MRGPAGVLLTSVRFLGTSSTTLVCSSMSNPTASTQRHLQGFNNHNERARSRAWSRRHCDRAEECARPPRALGRCRMLSCSRGGAPCWDSTAVPETDSTLRAQRLQPLTPFLLMGSEGGAKAERSIPQLRHQVAGPASLRLGSIHIPAPGHVGSGLAACERARVRCTGPA